MSKSLRMLLLSMLVVAVAAMPAMARTFYWTGATDNYWGNYKNWTADEPYSNDKHQVANNEYYPGRISADLVVISTDAAIVLTTANNTNTTGELTETITGISIDKKAAVSISFGDYGYFAKMPNINVVSGSLTLNSTTPRALGTAPTFAARDKSNLTLNLQVDTLGSGTHLTLSVDNGVLTINQASLLGHTTIKAAGSSQVVLNAQPPAAASGKSLQIALFDDAVLNTPSDVTLYANYAPSTEVSVISGDSDTFTKTGSGTLTFIRNTPLTSYDAPIPSTIKKVVVAEGSLVFGSARIAEHSFDITVSGDAKLDIAAPNAVYTAGEVELTVNGTATIAEAGIGTATSVYSSGVLSLDKFNVSADVSSTGTLTFNGSQPVNHLSGAGTVVVPGDSAVLIVNGSADCIAKFTGTLNASIVGLAQSFGNMPFENATGTIETVYVYGPAQLTLDAAKLADVDGMESTTIRLRSNYNAITASALNASTVGDLKVSGDVKLGTLMADGSRNSNGIAGVLFTSSKDILTVDTLILHANGTNDSAKTYAAVHALLISSDNTGSDGGQFIPGAIKNADGTASGGLGSDTSITVQGATLKLDVNIPASNSLVLDDATLDAANGVTIPGDLVLRNHNTFKVVLIGDNMKLYTAGHNAVNVDNNFVLAGNMSFDIDLQDETQAIGHKYRIIGPTTEAFNKLTSDDVGAMSVTGTLKGSMSISYDVNGVYGILEELALQPRIASAWQISKAGDSDSDFEAKLSYDIPANVEPASMINLISVDVEIAGVHFNKANSARQNINNLVYLKTFKVNSPDKEIVITGTLYATKAETNVTIGWNKVSKDWVPYETAGMYFNGQAVESRDFKPRDSVTLAITNPVEESPDQPAEPGTLSEDATADPNEIVIEAETPEITTGSGDVVLTINGIREAVVANTSAKPVLVGEVYVWMNGFDNTKKYEMLYNGNWILMESLDIRIDGVSVNLDSVDISGSNPITVTIPAALFDTEAAAPKFQNVTIVGTAPNGHTLTAGPASVHVVPDYEERPVDAGMGDIRYTTKDLPKSPIIVDGILDLTGPFSFDLTVNGSPETPSWFTWNVNSADGTIAYEVAAGAAAGTYNMRVIAYTAEGGYKYNFTLTITEGFKINDPDEPYGTIGGLNYEGRFTTENVPAGAIVEWIFPTNNLAWLKSAISGDMFVVYGQLPAYVDDEEAENDPNEYTYRVMAVVSGDTVSKDWTITVEEDTDEVVDHTQFEAGEITFPEGKDIISADSTYSVSIAFNEENYDTEIEFLSLPYWLKATPVTATVDDAEVITGYTITYNGKAVTAGETGVVRFEDPASGNIISWPVTFTQTIEPEPGPGPAPQSEDFTLTTSSTVSLTLGTAAGATSTLALETANALGEVSYTYTVTPNNGGLTVSISGSRATLTGSTAGTYTVTFTATDAGRPAGSNTATFATTVTVGGGVLPPVTSGDLTLGLSASSVSMNLGTQGGNTRTVTLTTGNADGAVSYTYTVTPATGLTVAISGDVATLTATTAGTYTVTFTATDAAGRTATSAATVTVTSGSGDVSQFSITVTPSTVRVSEDEIVSVATVTAVNATGEVEYTTSLSWVTVVDNTVVVDAPAVDRDTTYTVTITGTDSEGNTNTAQLTVVVLEGDIIPIVPGSVGSSGGGCDAGFGALALALAAPLFLRRRRS